MKKFSLFLVLVLLFFTSKVYAESPAERMVVERVRSATDSTLIPIPNTVTVYTNSFSLRDTKRLAIMHQTSATGAISYNVDLEQSYRKPTTEGSFDDAYRITDVLGGTIIDQAWKVSTIDTLTALPYGRFVITGTTNPSDAVIQLQIGKQ